MSTKKQLSKILDKLGQIMVILDYIDYDDMTTDTADALGSLYAVEAQINEELNECD